MTPGPTDDNFLKQIKTQMIVQSFVTKTKNLSQNTRAIDSKLKINITQPDKPKYKYLKDRPSPTKETPTPQRTRMPSIKNKKPMKRSNEVMVDITPIYYKH